MCKKYSFTLFLTFLIIPFMAFAQLKKDTKVPEFTSILAKPAESIFGFLDPSKMEMHHSFSMSFGMGGGSQILQNAYINTISYQFSEDLQLITNLGIMATPYHTFGENSSLNDPKFFGGAELNYKISENSSLHLRFESVPYNYYNYNNYYNRYYDSFYSPVIQNRP